MPWRWKFELKTIGLQVKALFPLGLDLVAKQIPIIYLLKKYSEYVGLLYTVKSS